MASEIKKPTKNNMCWDCLNEYRCDWLENIDGKCKATVAYNSGGLLRYNIFGRTAAFTEQAKDRR